jgi:hypothetical protein
MTAPAWFQQDHTPAEQLDYYRDLDAAEQTRRGDEILAAFRAYWATQPTLHEFWHHTAGLVLTGAMLYVMAREPWPTP